MLSLLTISYLALPYFLFAGGWLKPPLAVLAWMLLTSGIAIVFRGDVTNRPVKVGAHPRALFLASVVLLLAALAFTYWAGVGGWAFQHDDWAKHNAILYDLVSKPWPVAYQTIGNTTTSYLTYYLAYYLPAAAIGRYAGLAAAHYALFVWTAIGVWLSLHWIHRLSGASVWLIVGGWSLLGGMDFVGVAAFGGDLVNLRFPARVWSWYAGFVQYSANATLLQCVPQHAIGG